MQRSGLGCATRLVATEDLPCKSVPLASRAKSATARVFAMRWPSVRTPQLHETGHLISARRLRRGDRRNLNSGKSA